MLLEEHETEFRTVQNVAILNPVANSGGAFRADVYVLSSFSFKAIGTLVLDVEFIQAEGHKKDGEN